MIAPTVCRGFSDEYGSWKIIWISRRSGRIRPCRKWVMSTPSKTMLPPVGSSSLVSNRPVVVFPQPDSPTRPSVWPCDTDRSMPSTACTWPTACRNTTPLVTGK